MYIVSAAQMQNMDKEAIESFGIPGQVLMENAGKGSFDILLRLFSNIEVKKVCVLAGRGNNGGDGFVIARYLALKGIRTSLFLLSSEDRITGDAKANLLLAKKLEKDLSNIKVSEVKNIEEFKINKTSIVHHDIFVDAILGTGLNSDVRGFFKDVIKMLNSSGKPVFSVDIPSGLNSDTGKPCGIAVKAFATATFAFAKVGNILFPGNIYTGKLEVIDIGIPQFYTDREKVQIQLIEKQKIASFFKPRNFAAHKGRFGHLLVIAGSSGKTGAASLCCNAAMRCGTGLVTLGLPKSLIQSIEPQIIESMAHGLPETNKGCLCDSGFEEIQKIADNKSCIALGPGIGTNKETRKLVEQIILNSKIPVVLDADGLNCICENTSILKKSKTTIILTPHPGEMAKMTSLPVEEVQENRIEIASEFAVKHGVILVLKGAQTLISSPDGNTFISPTGNPGMASGGMGDVLTGMIAGFISQGLSCENAALAGVYTHGLSADIISVKKASFGFLASDIINIIPETLHEKVLWKNY